MARLGAWRESKNPRRPDCGETSPRKAGGCASFRGAAKIYAAIRGVVNSICKNIPLFVAIAMNLQNNLYNVNKYHIEVWRMNKIRELRQSRGWTQDDLAKKLNASRQSVGSYETEFRGLDVATICRICDIFGCTADYLLCRSENPAPVISDDDAALLAAFHAAPLSVTAAITTLLQPYREESKNEADQAI